MSVVQGNNQAEDLSAESGSNVEGGILIPGADGYTSDSKTSRDEIDQLLPSAPELNNLATETDDDEEVVLVPGKLNSGADRCTTASDM